MGSRERTLRYLNSFTNYEKVPAWSYKRVKLERFQSFLDTIEHPEQALRCIHVAGSKGKGSTCAFCAYILRAAGFRVGLYTSPHLVDFRERIRILEPARGRTFAYRTAKCSLVGDFEGMISSNSLARLVERLEPAIEKHARVTRYGRLTFFEVYTALAFLYFKERKVDFAVLETGLGGRLDATNAVTALVSVITPISYEHTDKLGTTLSLIAREKAGVIKGPSVVVSAPQAPQARQVIADRCVKKNALLFRVGKDISYTSTGRGFTVGGVFGTYDRLATVLAGTHQFENAAAAVGAAESLFFYGTRIGTEAIRCGIRSTRWPGRCEVVARRPYIVLDGAQNSASARALAAAIRGTFKYKKLILVVGISQDKDKEGIAGGLRSLADTVILTQADTSRATAPEQLAPYFKGKRMYTTANVAEAKKLARLLASADDLILVCGSLFVVGEFRR